MVTARKQIARRIVDLDLRRIEERIAVFGGVYAVQDEMAVADLDLRDGDVAVDGETEQAGQNPGHDRATAHREHAHGHESDCRHGQSRSPAHQKVNTHRWHRGLPSNLN